MHLRRLTFSPRASSVGVLVASLIVLSALMRAPALADNGPPADIPAINPVELQIPAIGVDANVQDVGLTADGDMDIPSNFTDVAWFAPGYQPGAAGNAVFDGHVSSTDAAAVFFNVQDLVAGNLINVTGDAGTVLTFQVDDVESYPLDSAPVDTIFGNTGWPQVVLITCGGDWHPDVHLFDHRTVVYAPLVSVTPAG